VGGDFGADGLEEMGVAIDVVEHPVDQRVGVGVGGPVSRR
jgi:hypothetical protein